LGKKFIIGNIIATTTAATATTATTAAITTTATATATAAPQCFGQRLNLVQ